ncbi:temptin-like [Ostrea edulis]|uniref:temptin-like n=1 Tax=Ostrea edulis TaxID=37623 RepID=UPI0024AEBBA3|nr:temptin-like [Ostrea edulis]
MAGSGLLSVIICVGFTSVCYVVSYPFYAYHKLPTSIVPVNCGGNSTVYEVMGIGHQLCGEDYINTKKENVTQFGKDFLKYMDDWSTLCKMDSDNDNRTNGQELGDPDCNWINKDERKAVSHPGYGEDEVIDENGEVSYVIQNQEEVCGTPDKVTCWRYTHGRGIHHR